MPDLEQLIGAVSYLTDNGFIFTVSCAYKRTETEELAFHLLKLMALHLLVNRVGTVMCCSEEEKHVTHTFLEHKLTTKLYFPTFAWMREIYTEGCF